MLQGPITQSFIDTFDTHFYAVLRERGSKMLNGVMPFPLQGRSNFKRQYETGTASIVSERGEDLLEVPTKYGKREMLPHEIRYAFSVIEIDQLQQLVPDVPELAESAANECGLKLDELIINGVNGRGGILGTAKSFNEDDTEKYISIPYTQFVPFNATPYGTQQITGATAEVKNIDYGLSVSKLTKAVSMLEDAENHPPYILVSSAKQQSVLRSDTRAANLFFNQQRATEVGMLQYPVFGVSGLIQSAQVPRNVKVTYFSGTDGDNDPAANTRPLGANSSPIEYAVLYALDQVHLGILRDFTLQTGTDVRKAFSNVFMYNGFFDCLRMQEKSVVVIECGDVKTTI
jgi:hypothetical protein